MALPNNIVREFIYEDITLTDPDIDMDVDEVIDFYTPQYPHLVNSTYEMTVEENTVKYTLKTKYGTKG